MEKYWAVDLEFVKAEGKYVDIGFNFKEFIERHFTYKKLSEYKLDNYIGSKVISRPKEWTFLAESGEPYKYLKVIKRFIIPSEVVISRKLYVYRATDKDEVLEKTKMKYSIKYVVDENKMKLKPSEIIYYREEKLEPYAYFCGNILHEVNDRTLILYDKKLEKYKYYRKYTDKEGIHRINQLESKVKEKVEYDYMNITYPVTPVENVEEVVT